MPSPPTPGDGRPFYSDAKPGFGRLIEGFRSNGAPTPHPSRHSLSLFDLQQPVTIYREMINRVVARRKYADVVRFLRFLTPINESITFFIQRK